MRSRDKSGRLFYPILQTAGFAGFFCRRSQLGPSVNRLEFFISKRTPLVKSRPDFLKIYKKGYRAIWTLLSVHTCSYEHIAPLSPLASGPDHQPS
jgi:hypothetical protein